MPPTPGRDLPVGVVLETTTPELKIEMRGPVNNIDYKWCDLYRLTHSLLDVINCRAKSWLLAIELKPVS